MSADSLQQRIRHILLTQWDPTDASRSAFATTAYDQDVEPIAALVESGADEDAISDYLYEREQQILCFPGIGKQRLRRIAQLLIATRTTGSSQQ